VAEMTWLCKTVLSILPSRESSSLGDDKPPSPNAYTTIPSNLGLTGIANDSKNLINYQSVDRPTACELE
jgi:hypothetical protein